MPTGSVSKPLKSLSGPWLNREVIRPDRNYSGKNMAMMPMSNLGTPQLHTKLGLHVLTKRSKRFVSETISEESEKLTENSKHRKGRETNTHTE